MTQAEVEEAAALLLRRSRLKTRADTFRMGFIVGGWIEFHEVGTSDKIRANEAEADSMRGAARAHVLGLVADVEARLLALGVELEAAP